VLDRLDADGVVVDVERARRLAWRGADASRELREVVGLVQRVERGLPLLPVHEVVPVRDDVVHGASRHAERDAAVHAARALLGRGVVGQREDELAVVVDALGDRFRHLGDTLEFKKSGDFSHSWRPRGARAEGAWRSRHIHQ
jgi:hypothetical protein